MIIKIQEFTEYSEESLNQAIGNVSGQATNLEDLKVIEICSSLFDEEDKCLYQVTLSE